MKSDRVAIIGVNRVGAGPVPVVFQFFRTKEKNDESGNDFA